MGRIGPFEENTIVCDDAIKVMAQLPEACVDAIVTDPPYGLEFMGKEWDRLGNVGRNRKKAITRSSFGTIMGPDYKAPRIVRSQRRKCVVCGGYSGGPFQLCSCDTPQWIPSPYPLAMQRWHQAWATEAYRILKPGAYMLVMGGTRTHHRLGCGLEDAGFEIKDCLMWIHSQGFPKGHDISKAIDKRAGAEREIISTEKLGGTAATLKGKANRDNWHDQGEGGTYTPIYHRTKPSTPEAEYWQGYNVALKPAHEPIWLCKKPNEGTYVDNVLKHGCGAMNIDGSRIEYQMEVEPDVGDMYYLKRGLEYPGQGKLQSKIMGRPSERVDITMKSGRWPANVIVDCYPEEFQGGMVIEGEGTIAGKGQKLYRRQDASMFLEERGTEYQYPIEPNRGNGLLGPYTRFFVIPKPSKAEKTCNGTVENKHVTVKPVRLGKWLIKLITPHQHPVIMIDPFCGSGSFLVAAQELNYEGYQIKFYGIDKDEDSVKTALARLEKDRAARQMEMAL